MNNQRPLVVGILNCTPDSFHDGGRFTTLDTQVRQAYEMLEQGADWIDIGGESTRPGAPPVTEAEELARVLPVIRALGPDVPISIDTSKPNVARQAVQFGARMLNDVTGLELSEMAAISADVEAMVVMHSRGTPQNMSTLNQYQDLCTEISQWLVERAQRSKSQQTFIDPGIGFAKNQRQSLFLLQQTQQFVATGYPVYIGASRKSFIGHTLRLPQSESRLSGSLAAACVAFERGAAAFRVHDVAPTRQALDLAFAVQQASLC